MGMFRYIPFYHSLTRNDHLIVLPGVPQKNNISDK